MGRISAVAVRSRCGGGRRTARHSSRLQKAAQRVVKSQRPSGVWAAHELADTETIAKLTTGVKRFTLPDEFNHIAILKAVIARTAANSDRLWKV